MTKHWRYLNLARPSNVSIAIVNSTGVSGGRGKDSRVFKVMSMPYMCAPAGDIDILVILSWMPPCLIACVVLFDGLGSRIAELKSWILIEAIVASSRRILAIPAKTRFGSTIIHQSDLVVSVVNDML